MLPFEPRPLETLAYVCDTRLLEQNLQLLARVQAAGRCKILLALKAFAMWSTFPLIGKYLAGAAASSLFEAQLASDLLKGEVCPCARQSVRWPPACAGAHADDGEGDRWTGPAD
jgi:carboxynorspermidine decarboxylase